MNERDLLVDCLRRLALRVDFWQTGPSPSIGKCLADVFGSRSSASTHRVSPSERHLADAAGIIAVQANALG